jgi:hypothetical protein
MSTGPPPSAAHPGLAGEPVYLDCNATTPVRVQTPRLGECSRWATS